MTDTSGAFDEWRLRDEREFLVQSLDDAAREHAAGDLTDGDFGLLRRRDEQRLAEVDAALAGAAERIVEQPTRRPVQRPRTASGAWPAGAQVDEEEEEEEIRRPRRRLWLALTGVAFLIAGAICLVLDVTSPRQAGEASSGTTERPAVPRNELRQQLAEADKAAAAGTDTEALTLYGDVISEDPDNAMALASWGWLDWRGSLNQSEVTATVAAVGQSAVVRALALDNKLYPAQYYLGDIFYQEHEYKQAVEHLGAFLADNPPAQWLDKAAPVVRSAYTLDKQAIPADVPMTPATPTATG